MTDQTDPPVYRALMALKPADWSPNKWLTAARLNRNFFTDLRQSGNAKHSSLEKLLDAIDVSLVQFEATLAADRSPTQNIDEALADARLPFNTMHDLHRDLPVMGTAYGGEILVQDNGHSFQIEQTIFEPGHVVDFIRRPPGIPARSHAYAIQFQGESMVPRFRPGELGIVDPRRTPAIGDDVILYLLGDAQEDGQDREIVSVLVKTLRRRTAAFVELEQYNPAVTFRIANERIARIHRLSPTAEVLGF